MDQTIGFIGCGNMATAIAKGILNSGIVSASQLWASGPRINQDEYKHWKEMGVNTTVKNGEVFCSCEIVFLGVKPLKLSEAMSECSKSQTFRKGGPKIVVSMLAGVTIKQIQDVTSAMAEDHCIIRIMPNMPMLVGQGACIVSPDINVTKEQLDSVVQLLSTCAICQVVKENMIDGLGTLTGCGPAFMYIIIEALADGAVMLGVPRAIALSMAAQMITGAGQMVLKTGKHPGQLKDEVCSPGGSTICGVRALEDGKVRSTMMAAIVAAHKKTQEFAKSPKSGDM